MKFKNLNLLLIPSLFLIFSHNRENLNARPLPSVSGTNSLEFTSSNLPILVIDTYGETIVDNYRIVANMGIIDNGKDQRNNLTDPFNDYHGRIAIELRGSSSISYPKKQYRLETQDSSGANFNVSLLGLPRENDWILYGPYDDLSLIRNVLAFKLSNDMGRYASRTRFCELILNNDYRGLYILMEKIKQDNNRVNITEMDSLDIAGDSVTGGYIIKIDKIEGENIGLWSSSRGVLYQYHYPKADEIISAQEDYIQNLMDEFEAVMSNPNPAHPDNGYPKYIDIDSFVDHFILSELCKNVDAYRISTYIYKDRDSEDGKLNMGPIWDFNLSLGKAWFQADMYITEGWQVDYNYHRPNDWPKVPFWWEILGHNSEFVNRATVRWHELRSGILQKDSLFRYIDLYGDTLAEARVRDFEKWHQGIDYEQEIELLKQWIDDRIDWIDENIEELTSLPRQSTENIPQYFGLEQNHPNPFNTRTVIRYQLPVNSQIRLTIYDLMGRTISTLVNGVQKRGEHQVIWNGEGLPSGLYFYQLQAGDPSSRNTSAGSGQKISETMKLILNK